MGNMTHAAGRMAASKAIDVVLKKVGHMQELINKYDEVCKELKSELKNQQEQFEKKLGEQAQEKYVARSGVDE